MSVTEFKKELIPSTLENFQDREIDILTDYIELIRKHADAPEILLYNFARATRTQDITKFLVYHEVYKEILNVPGSIVEAGVLEGNTIFSFAHFSEIYEHRNYTRQVLGFDFENGYNLPCGQRIEASTTDLMEEAIALFNRSTAFHQFDKIKYIKGPIAERVEEHFSADSGQVCALLVLRVGLYDVEKTVLETVWPRMPKGAVLLLCSFGYEGTPQCTQVVEDVLGIGNCEFHRFPFATKYCYVKKT